jgi:hypothetical protein
MSSFIASLAGLGYSEILRLFIVLFIILGFFAGCLYALYKFLIQFKSARAKLPRGIEFETVSRSGGSPNDFVALPTAPKVTDVTGVEDHLVGVVRALPHVLPFTEHNFFNLLRRVVHNGVVVQSRSEVKAQVIKSFISTYSTVLHDKMVAWVSSVVETEGQSLSDISSVKMDISSRYLELSAVSSVLITYKNRKLVLKGVPQLFLDKFQLSHQPQVLILVDQISDIVTDVFHPSWQSKLIAILDVFESIYRCNFIGLNNTIKDLNGELDAYLEAEIKNL